MRLNMKIGIGLAVFAAVQAFSGISAAADGEITVKINGEDFAPRDVSGSRIYPIISEGRAFLPLRAVGEAFDINIDWDGNTNTVYIGERPSEEFTYSEDVRIVLDGEVFSCVDENGSEIKPFISEGITYLPLRGASIAFDKDIEWIAQSKTVVITDKTGEETEYNNTEENTYNKDLSLMETLVKNVEEYNREDIDITAYNVTSDELKKTVEELINRPEYYYVSGDFMYAERNGMAGLCRFDYTVEKDIVEEVKEYNDRGEYKIFFTGDWDSINSTVYKDKLEDIFYEVYPRIVKRWGDETTSTAIVLNADKDFNLGQNVVGFTHGRLISFDVDYANENPNDFGFLPHELTHVVQQYVYFNSTWWTENMANYGRFRYYHWAGGATQDFDYYSVNVRDWKYEPYGNCQWFFSYLDYKYPTVRDSDGNLKLGLIDSINQEIKAGNIDSDGGIAQLDGGFNAVVKRVTGYENMEELRKKYVEELNDKSWTFQGFGDYKDNFITEGIRGVPQPVYTEPKN